MAQAACSRVEPQPKFFPATSIFPLYCGLFNGKSCFWLLFIIIFISPVTEQIFTKSIPGGCFQETRRNDLVGINIFDIDREQTVLCINIDALLFAHWS